MERITDAWGDLGQRERMLAITAGVVLLLVILLFILLGGDPEVPVDGSTTAAEATPLDQFGPVKPKPGMIVSSNVPAEPAPTKSAGGVAGITVAAGGGGSSGDGGLKELEAEAARNHVEEPWSEGAYIPPVVSDAIKAAGRDLERVAKAYTDCMKADAAANRDSRHCVNDTLKYGVSIDDGGLHRNGGITLTKMSSDGHKLNYTVLSNGGDCRTLDEGESCDAWTAF